MTYQSRIGKAEELFSYANLTINVYPAFTYFGGVGKCQAYTPPKIIGGLEEYYINLQNGLASQKEIGEGAAKNFFDELSAIDNSINSNWDKLFKACIEVDNELFKVLNNADYFVSKNIKDILENTRVVINSIENIKAGMDLYAGPTKSKMFALMQLNYSFYKNMDRNAKKLSVIFGTKLDEKNNKSFEEYQNDIRDAAESVREEEKKISEIPAFDFKSAFPVIGILVIGGVVLTVKSVPNPALVPVALSMWAKLTDMGNKYFFEKYQAKSQLASKTAAYEDALLNSDSFVLYGGFYSWGNISKNIYDNLNEAYNKLGDFIDAFDLFLGGVKTRLIEVKNICDKYKDSNTTYLTRKEVKELNEIYEFLKKQNYEKIMPVFKIEGDAMTCVKYT